MEPVEQGGLKVDETFMGVNLHIDQEKWESWIEVVAGSRAADGILAAEQRARSLGYALIPETEDEGVVELLDGIVRHWMAPIFNEGEEEAAA